MWRGAGSLRVLVGVVCAAVVLVVLVGAAPAALVAAMVGRTLGAPGMTTPARSAGPGTAAASGVPAAMLQLYRRAARVCPGLPWTVLAAIGTIESSNGTSTLSGVHRGANWAGAEGPMQFEPATFALYDEPVPPGGADPPSPYDPVDAVYAAARDLCATGAAGGADLAAAVFAYNHSASYVSRVLTLAQSYGMPAWTAGRTDGREGDGDVAASVRGGIAADWALAQVGTPYVWGGETPGVGFDCSGLVQAAYEVAGITLPRVAQDQFDAGRHLAASAPLVPGDLVFFGGGSADVSHVGIYVGAAGGLAYMVDAPHRGADVRVEMFPAAVGASFGGGEVYVGATRPAR